MTYGVIVNVTGPLEAYDTIHRELIARSQGKAEGLLLHIGRAVPDGFQVTEVWESKEQFDRFNREVVWPLAAEIASDAPDLSEPVSEDFEPRGLIVPKAGIAW